MKNRLRLFYVTLLLFGLLPILLNAQQSFDLSEPISKQLDLRKTTEFIEMPEFNVQKFIEEKNDAVETGIKSSLFAKSFDRNFKTESSGKWTSIEDGKLWQIAFSSKGAYSLNLILSKMKIPKGAVIFAYTPGYKDIAGPFTSDYNTELGILPIQPLSGDKIILEYYEPKDAKFRGEFAVTKISHDFTDILKTSSQRNFNDSAACNECINANSAAAWQDEKRSVALIITNGNRNCSGALINNVGSVRGRPFFLTANHCISGNSAAAGSVFMFQYENQCNGVDGSTHMVVNGSTRRASNAASDFSLLEMNARIPSSYRPFFAGFNRINSTPSRAIGIHHPRGDVKKISFENNALTSTNYYSNTSNTNANHWRVANWDIGVTERASSGSPLFDNNSRIIGQLHGGDAACSGSNDNGLPDWYGKFSTSWSGSSTTNQQLRTWLAGSANPSALNGYSAPGWRHGWMGAWSSSSANAPHGSAKAITVGAGNQVFYRKNSNNRIYTYYWSNSNNQWNHASISSSNSSYKVAGDLVVGEGNQLFYRGVDGRMQSYYYSNGWHHAWIDNNWSTSAYKISSSCGSIAVGENNQIFYKSTSGRMHTFYWTSSSGWLHGYLPYSSSNWKVAGDIVVGNGNQIFYRGADGKMQTYYWSNSQWNHGYLSTSVQVNSGCGSITVGGNNSVFFKGTDNWIRVFYKTGSTQTSYSMGYISDWTSNTRVSGTLSTKDGNQLFFRGYDGKMHVYYWGNSQWNHDWIETSWQAPSQHSVKYGGAIAVGIGNQLFYKGNDNKMHQYFYDSTGFRSNSNNYSMEEVTSSPTLPLDQTSIDGQTSDLMIVDLYPNPTIGEFNLKFKINSSQTVSVSIIDAFGSEVLSVFKLQDFDSGEYDKKIKINLLKSGVYFCLIESEKGRVIKKLLVN